MTKFLLAAVFKRGFEQRIGGFINLGICFIALMVLFTPVLLAFCGLNNSTDEKQLDDVDLSSYAGPRRIVWNHGFYSRHYHIRKRALLKKLKKMPPRRKQSDRAYYQNRRKKQECQQAHRDERKRQANDHWEGCAPDEELLFDRLHEWIHLESKFLGLDNLFGSFKDLKSQVVNWRIGVQSQSQGPDPLKQFKAIKMISTDSFLKSEVVRKSTKWKSRDQA